jgi:hypothetical protein
VASNLIETLGKEILDLYRSDVSRADVLIESCLERGLRSLSPDEKLAALKDLIGNFASADTPGGVGGGTSDLSELSNLFSQFLGKRISDDYLLSTDFLEKLADSLNTLFNSLNETVAVIDSVLLGSEGEAETIKAIISSSISGDKNTDSLLNYLDKIRRAFLISQKAFREVAQRKFEEMLEELDPDRISAMPSGFLSFGPFRKAEFFAIYKEKHQMVRKYLESGRLMEEMLREFERSSQKLYGKGTRGDR